MNIPYDPDFDPPRAVSGGLNATPARTAYIFGLISGIGLGAIAGIILLI